MAGDTPKRETVAGLSAKLSEAQETNAVLLANMQEAVAELELAIEDQGWLKSGSGATMRDFSRDGLRAICRESFLFYEKNPLIHRAVLLEKDYVFGLGITIKGDHPGVDAVVQQFLSDKKNEAELTTVLRMAETNTDLKIDANIFIRIFTNSMGRVRVRCVPFDEIEDVVCNPEDRKEPWYYVRTRPDGKQEALPDWRYRPANKPASIKPDASSPSIPVDWSTPIYHVSVNRVRGQKFGVSELYAAQDWARAHNKFLSDWATIVRSYARFAWDVVKKGSAAARAALKNQLDSGISSGQRAPSPATGSAAIHDEDVQVRPMKTAGATTSADDGRRILLQVCAATGWPETFFGDVSVGTLATAKSLDRPTELRCINRQRLWQMLWEELLEYVAQVAAEHKLEGLSGGWAKGDWNEEEFVWGVDTTSDDPDKMGEPIDPHVSVTFPDLVERDMKESVEAIVAASPLIPDAQFSAEALLRVLGEKDIEEIMERMFPDGESPEAQNMRDMVGSLQGAIDQMAAGQEQDRAEVVGAMAEAFVEAIRKLQEDDA